jgi:nickel/cobalt exporter
MNLVAPNAFYQQLLIGSSGSVAAAMLASLVLGAIHGASPGHGKTLVVASLMGSNGSYGRVGLLALTVALTHTAGVLVLAALVLGANDSLLPQAIQPYMTLAADILVVLFGADLVRRAWWALITAHHVEDHDDPSGRGHPHEHSARTVELTRGYTISIGVVGGFVPNGTALVVLLLAIALHKLLLGLLLVATFGAGIALVLGLVGLGAVLVQRSSRRFGGASSALSRAVHLLPLASGVMVMAVGFFLMVGAVSAL